MACGDQKTTRHLLDECYLDAMRRNAFGSFGDGSINTAPIAPWELARIDRELRETERAKNWAFSQMLEVAQLARPTQTMKASKLGHVGFDYSTDALTAAREEGAASERARMLMEEDPSARPVLNNQLVTKRAAHIFNDSADSPAFSLGGAGVAKIHMERMAAIREAAFLEERGRILAALQAIAPMEQPYSRRDWALEQKGAREHHAKVLKAIQEPKKDSHEG